MNKEILQEYVDACELVKETEKDLRRLEQRRQTEAVSCVKGSMQEFPYVEQRIKVRGNASSEKDDRRMKLEKKLLEQRRENAEMIKLQVEEWMLMISPRMQRIIKYRYLEELPWEQVAIRMGRRATADSVRMEMNNFLK